MTKIPFTIVLAAALSVLAFAQSEPAGIVTAQAFPNVFYKQELSQTAGFEVSGNTVRTQMMMASPVTGKPFSASQDLHSLQILGDGTRIERTETSQISRDSLGRTRTEAAHTPGENPSFATIQDPTDGSNAILNLDAKTADHLPVPQVARRLGRSATAAPSGAAFAQVNDGPILARGGSFAAVTGAGAGVGIGAGPNQIVINQSIATLAKPEIEDLGTQTINGVVAKGSRTTSTIPAGQIGNDRPIQIVNERWYSDDLQMVVKSSNSDPRFGTTEFNLTGINRAEPDPSLFQVPASYKVNSPK
jgi:hypothetical protein